MQSKRVFIRTDKNGTKIYHDYTCQRCGGLGGSDAWSYTGWTCYECGGTGERSTPIVDKIYTPEYRAKLEERAQKRAEKKRLEAVAAFNANRLAIAERMGFNSEGKVYVVIGNTFNIKDELKAAGARYRAGLNWYFLSQCDTYPTIEIDYTEVLDVHEHYGTMDWKPWSDVKAIVGSKYPQDIDTSEHIGSIGDRITLDVTLSKVSQFEVRSYCGYGYDTQYIYNFRDASNNCIIYKSSAYLRLSEGDKASLTGTVKEHSEYKGIKQTVLQRCKAVKQGA